MISLVHRRAKKPVIVVLANHYSDLSKVVQVLSGFILTILLCDVERRGKKYLIS